MTDISVYSGLDGGNLFDGLNKGQAFVNGLFQQNAARKAGGLISQGNYAGAGAALGDVGDLKDQEAVNATGVTVANRSNTQQYLGQQLNGDYTGAAQTAALTADPAAVAGVQAAGLAAKQRDTTALANAADGLLQINVPDDPAATNAVRHQKFTTDIAPLLKSQYGIGDDQLAQVEHSDLSDQSLQAFKTSLGQADKFTPQITPDGNVIAFDSRTGKGSVAYAGTPKPITTDGGYLTQGDDGQWHFNATGAKSEYKVVADAQGNSHVILVGGAVGPGSGASAGVATTAGAAPTGKVYDDMASAAVAKGASPSEVDLLKREMQTESHGDPTAQNGSSTGYFQFHPDTFAANGGGDIHSLPDQTGAALTLLRKNASTLSAKGIPVTPANIYLLHQQGPGGISLLTAPPETNAIAALTPAYAKQYGSSAQAVATKAIVGNGGNPNMTASQFVQQWTNKFGGGPAPGGAGGAALGQEVYSTAGEGGASGGLSPASLTQAARMYAVTGQLPQLARGKAGNADKEAIINEASTLGGPDILAGKAQYQAASAGLKTAVERQTTVLPAAQKALATLDEAIAFAKQKQAQGKPVISSGGVLGGLFGGISAAANSAISDPDFIHYRNLLQDAANEQAVAVSGARTGGSTDSARREANGRLNENMPLATIISGRDAFATVLDKAKQSAASIVAQRKADINNILTPAAPQGQAAVASPAAAQAPTSARPQASQAPIRVTSPAQAHALAPGTPFITPDGRQKIR